MRIMALWLGRLFGWLRRRHPKPERVSIAEPPPKIDPIEELTRILGEEASEPISEPVPKRKPVLAQRRPTRRRPGRR